MKTLSGTSTLILAILMISGSLSPAWAQLPPEPPAEQEKRNQRFLLIGNASFVDSFYPTITAGGLYQISIAPRRVTTADDGRQIIRPPRWYVHGLFTGGLNFEDDIDVTGFGQIGFMRRSDHTFFTALGPAAQTMFDPFAIGPVARFEIVDNFGLQGGVLFVDGDPVIYVSLDYFRTIWGDLLGR